MNNKLEAMNTLPLSAKFASIAILIISIFFVLFIGRDIVVPIIFSTIIAILLNPIVVFLERKKVNRVFAIFLAVVLAIVCIVTLSYFIISQSVMLSDSIPLFKEKFLLMRNDFLNWVSNYLSIDKPRIHAWIDKIKIEGSKNSTVFIGSALGTIGGVAVLVLLLPVYIFMILFYKPLLLEFISQLFKSNKQEVVGEILNDVNSLIQKYLMGLLLEAAIIATLNSVGLLILGIQYAILIGIIGALLNMIPYIGGLIAISLPMLLAVATKSPVHALWVFIMYLFIQFVDNNYIVPKIVASKVKVNALVSIIVVLLGGALWGIAGMFLAIPLIAIIKVVFDRIDSLKPFGFLIGDNQPLIGSSIFQLKKTKK